MPQEWTVCGIRLAHFRPMTGSPGQSGSVRVGAIADLHFGRHAAAAFAPLLTTLSEAVDVLMICGDLTDHGDPEEARGLARELKQHLRAPVVAVLGNHDHEMGRAGEVASVMRDAGVTVLDGDSCEVLGLGFAGVKGFCGGFGPRALGSWGEAAIKQFVQESVNEALKLETALARLRARRRLVLLHYSPVVGTVVGEPPEIFPFLGSSRLEEPLARYGAMAVCHGHAHHGHAQATLKNGTPVYNVSLPLLERTQPDRPFVVIDCEPAGELEGTETPAGA
jgi:Icc-related predicted phosphoesterase